MLVLITAGLSPEAYRLQRVLNTNDVIFADQTPMPQIPGVLGLTIPIVNSGSFVHELLKLCLDHQVSHVYPLKYDEIKELSKARTLFEEYAVRLIIPSDSWLERPLLSAPANASEIVVLENGLVRAGTLAQDDSDLNGETGVFCQASISNKMVYYLYLA